MADPQLTDGTKVREIVLRRCRPSAQRKMSPGTVLWREAQVVWRKPPARDSAGRCYWKKKSGAKLCLSQTDLWLLSALGFLRHSHRKPWRNRT
jgi:hypothetical protein